MIKAGLMCILWWMYELVLLTLSAAVEEEVRALAPPVWAHCGAAESLPVALLAVSTNSSGHDRREEVGSKRRVERKGEGGGVGSVSELADGSQNMKQCRGNVWWVRCTELQAREQACWGNYSLMGSFGRQLPGVNVVWRDEVRLKWNFWLENVFEWKGEQADKLCADGVGGWLGGSGKQARTATQIDVRP